MNDKKDVDDLDKIFAAGDAWLLKYGVVSPITHNNIIVNLYVNFPKCKYVEYLMSPNERKIHVIMHYPLLSLIFRNRDAIIDAVISLLKDYLHNYDITVELKRYKKGVEKSDVKTEIPGQPAATP